MRARLQCEWQNSYNALPKVVCARLGGRNMQVVNHSVKWQAVNRQRCGTSRNTTATASTSKTLGININKHNKKIKSY